MHDYLSKAKSSNFHYFVLSRGTVRGAPWPIVIAGEKSRLLHSLIYYIKKGIFGRPTTKVHLGQAWRIEFPYRNIREEWMWTKGRARGTILHAWVCADVSARIWCRSRRRPRTHACMHAAAAAAGAAGRHAPCIPVLKQQHAMHHASRFWSSSMPMQQPCWLLLAAAAGCRLLLVAAAAAGCCCAEPAPASSSSSSSSQHARELYSCTSCVHTAGVYGHNK